MQKIAKVFSPSKLNLFFAITGIRNDGYHDVYSLNAAINFGDTMIVSINDLAYDRIIGLPSDINPINSTIQYAINLFRNESGYNDHYDINIEKIIPVGAGFGGGSSNATTTLLALNNLHNYPLSIDSLHKLCHKIGADCGFFLNTKPCITTGIGDNITQLDDDTYFGLQHYRLWIIKPLYSSSTITAYHEMKSHYQHNYISNEEAAARCSKLLHAICNNHDILPLYNTFSTMLYKNHPEIKLLHEKLFNDGIQVMFSGSGSGFFGLQNKQHEKYDMISKISSFFEHPLWCKETSFLL